jgi:hypothetical protein
VRGVSAAATSSALQHYGAAIGVILRDGDEMRFTAPGTADTDVIAALNTIDADVKVLDELGSVSVVSAGIARKPAITATAMTTLDTAGIEPQLVTTTPGRVTAHISTELVNDAVRLLHDAFIPQPDIPRIDDTTGTDVTLPVPLDATWPHPFTSRRGQPYPGVGGLLRPVGGAHHRSNPVPVTPSLVGTTSKNKLLDKPEERS